MAAATHPRGSRSAPAVLHAGKAGAAPITPEAWLAIALTAVGGLLRFATLTAQSFWLDEATTVHEVGLSLGSMLHELRLNETTPPLYFLLAWVWTHVLGDGEAAIRSLSALAGTALVPVAYLCGRELVSRRAGVVAAALTAVSPFMIWYSQEARSYALFALFSALSLLFWARACRTSAGRDLALWSLACVLAVLTHFFAAFLVGPEALWLLWRVRTRASGLAVATVVAAQLAVLPLALGDTSHPLNWITAFPLSLRIQQIPVAFGFAELYKSPAVHWGLAGAGILLAVVLGLLALTGRRRERVGAAAAGALAACVILLPVVLAEAGRDYVFARNLTPAWIPLAVVVGAACTGVRFRWAGSSLAVLLIAAFVWGGIKIDGDPAYQRPDWRGVAAALGAAPGPRAVVAYGGNAAEQPLAVYLPHTRFSYSGMPPTDAPALVQEVDVVGYVEQSIPAHLPSGVRLRSQTGVDNLLVTRFTLVPARRLEPSQLAALAPRLLGPAPGASPSVLIQH